MDTRPTWSFSGIKSFESCAKKYNHLKVLKDYTEPQTDAMTYGKVMHRAAEDYIKGSVIDIDPRFQHLQDTLDKLKALPGEQMCEFRMALTADLAPTEYFADDVWLRSVSDYLVVDGADARVVDYKTSKNTKYADTGQLELTALCVFKYFPEVTTVRCGLLYVVCNAFIKETYTRDNESALWQKWLSDYHRLEQAYKHEVWNPNPSGLCKKHCVVLDCPHNGRN